MLTRMKTFASALAIMTALGAGNALAQEGEQAQIASENRAQVEGAVSDEATRQLSDKRAQLLEEAVTALDETKNAITALEEGRTDEAINALAIATGKLETIIARSPDLALAPVAVNNITYDLIADVQAIRDIGNRVEDLVEDGEFQAARAVLSNFASEFVVQTVSLPLATYPDAILEATALIDEGKTDEALAVLNTALSTQVVTEKIVPLAPLRAEAMIAEAEKLLNGEAAAAAEDSAGSEAEELTAGDYVEAARRELRIGEALGYGTEDDFADIYEALEDLDEKIDASEDTVGILDVIGDRFDALKSRLFDGSRDS